MKKDVKFEWTPERNQAFEELKKIITSEPVLIHPDLSKPFFIKADASLTGIGAILSQATEDGKLHPVKFFSHGLNATE